MSKPSLMIAAAVLLSGGCAAAGFGGPKPVELDVVAVRFDQGTSTQQAATQLRELGADIALIQTPRDSVWTRDLATQMQLTSSRPGRADNITLAFLARKPEGDTTMTLTVGNGRVRMHDALYKIDGGRLLDLMTIVVEPGTSARDIPRAMLNYIASDVPHNAVTVVAIQTPNPAMGDTIAESTRAAWADAWECTEQGRRGERAPGTNLRLFYFPPARVTCTEARSVTVGGNGMAAKLIIDR